MIVAACLASRWVHLWHERRLWQLRRGSPAQQSVATGLCASPSSSGPLPSRMVGSSLSGRLGCIRHLELVEFHLHGICVHGRIGLSFNFVTGFKETCVGTSNPTSNCGEDCLPDKLCARTTRACSFLPSVISSDWRSWFSMLCLC